LSAIGEFYDPASGVRERIGYLAGASGQLELRQGLALEVDAVYKPMRYSSKIGTVLTWDFPVLAKYHLAKLGRRHSWRRVPLSGPPAISMATTHRISA
jgi:hypothetical protein